MVDANIQRKPEYLVIGHVAKDLLDDGSFAPGGTILYSGLTAQRLGLQTAVVTACSEPDRWLLDQLRAAGVWVHVKASEQTTTFTNRYDSAGIRTQLVSAHATALYWDDIPSVWCDADILHLGPIAQELPSSVAPTHRTALLGITPQGWLRDWNSEGKVTHAAWPPPPALNQLPGNSLVVMSREDLGFDNALVAKYVRLVPQLVLTNGSEPASVFVDGTEIKVPALFTNVADPTGAGDVFGAALFVRYREMGDLSEAVAFAHASAALSIGARGTLGIGSNVAVGQRRQLDADD